MGFQMVTADQRGQHMLLGPTQAQTTEAHSVAPNPYDALPQFIHMLLQFAL